MSVIILFIFALVLFIYIFLDTYGKRLKGLPPGPPTLPIVGSMPFLHGEGLSNKLSNKSLEMYGDDFCSVWMGSRLIIIIQNFKLTRELFAKEECSARAGLIDGINNVRSYKGKILGIAATSGYEWQEQRRFSLKHLKDLGFGKQSLETYIQDEAKYVIDNFIMKAMDNHNGDVLMDGIFNVPIVNILWRIVASKRNDPTSTETKLFMQKLTRFFSRGPHPIQFIPYIQSYRPWTAQEKNAFSMKDMFRDQIIEHLREYNDSDEPRDFIDIYLRQIEIEKKEKGSHYGMETSTFHIEQLVTICLDFFSAGSETTSTTLTWAVMYLALYPSVQEICQLEVDRYIKGVYFFVKQ